MNENKRIADLAVFEDRIDNKEYGTTTLYFHAPKDLIRNPEYSPYEQYPDAEATDISVEFPTNQPESKEARVMFGPIKDGSTYDWVDVDLPYEEVDALLRLAERACAEKDGDICEADAPMFRAVAYTEDDGTVADAADFDDRNEAIEFAKSHNWDAVIDLRTNKNIWSR